MADGYIHDEADLPTECRGFFALMGETAAIVTYRGRKRAYATRNPLTSAAGGRRQKAYRKSNWSENEIVFCEDGKVLVTMVRYGDDGVYLSGFRENETRTALDHIWTLGLAEANLRATDR